MTQATAPLSEEAQRSELDRQVKLLYKQLADQYRQGKNINALLLEIFDMLAGHGMAGTWPLTPRNFKRDNYAYETNNAAHINFAEAAIKYLRKKPYNLAFAKAAGIDDPQFIGRVMRGQANFSLEDYERAIAVNPKLESIYKNPSFSYDQVVGLFLKEVEAEYNSRKRGNMPPYPLKNYHAKDGTIDPDEPPLPGQQDRDKPKPPKPLKGGAEAELVTEGAAPVPAVARVSVPAASRGRVAEPVKGRAIVESAPPPPKPQGGSTN